MCDRSITHLKPLDITFCDRGIETDAEISDYRPLPDHLTSIYVRYALQRVCKKIHFRIEGNNRPAIQEEQL